MRPMSWKPILEGNPNCPIFHLTAVLECPFCHHVQDAQSAFVVIGGETTLEAAVEETLGSIRKQRNCERCGIISCLPAADSKKLGQEATETLTSAWLENERKAMKPI